MYMKKERGSRGFTLIELLVVISIIGLLSSVVLASLQTARAKANDASIQASVRQFAILLETERTERGSYAYLQSDWDYTVAECNNSFATSFFVTRAREICVDIIERGGGQFYTGTNNTTFPRTSNYAIMARLPGQNTYFCVGSSGRNSDTTPSPADNWNREGCYNNP